MPRTHFRRRMGHHARVGVVGPTRQERKIHQRPASLDAHGGETGCHTATSHDNIRFRRCVNSWRSRSQVERDKRTEKRRLGLQEHALTERRGHETVLS